MKPCDLPAALATLSFVASAKWYPANDRELQGQALGSPVRAEFADFCGAVVATTAEGYSVRVEYGPWHGRATANMVQADGLRIASMLAQSLAAKAMGIPVPNAR